MIRLEVHKNDVSSGLDQCVFEYQNRIALINLKAVKSLKGVFRYKLETNKELTYRIILLAILVVNAVKLQDSF